MAKLQLGVVRLLESNGHYSLSLSEGQKKQCQDLFKICGDKHNFYCRVEFATPKKYRSTGKYSQGAHLNGHIQQICEETGNEFDMVKMAVKERAIDMGYPMLLDSEGVPKKGLYGIRLGISEADSSPKECSLLIDSVHQLASEEGIVLIEGKK